MLRHFAITVLGLAFSASVWSQDYTIYHQQINRAEEFLVQEDFQAALAIYQDVVDSFDFVFVKDVVIAAQIAAHLDRTFETSKWLEEAFDRGLRQDCLEEIPVFANFIQQPEYERLLDDYKEQRKDYFRTVNLDEAREWAKRYEREQNAKGGEFYRDVVLRNFERIQTFTKSDVFPGDRIIGVDYSRFGKGLSDCELGNSKVIVTLLHQPYAYSTMEGALEKAVQEGFLHPRERAMIYVFEQTKQSTLYKTTLQEDVTIEMFHFNLPFQKQHSDLDRVNSDRQRFLLGTIETEEAKKALESKYGFKLFFGYR